MELLAPVAALAGLYVVSNQNKKENFSQRTGRYENNGLPNIDVPNTNYPQEYPVQNPPNDLTSELSTVNKYAGGSAYTDKYFNPNSQSSLVGSISTQNSQMFSNRVPVEDIISIGTELYALHSPAEKVNHTSVAKVWPYVKAVVSQLN